MIAAPSTDRLPAPAAGWLQPLSRLGLDGLVALLALLIAPDPLFSKISAIEYDDNLILGYWTLLTLLLGYRLWQHCQDGWLRWSLRHLRPMLLLLAVALVSPLWSLNPAESAQRAVWLAELTFLGLFIGYRFYTRDLHTLLLSYFGVLLISSILLVSLSGIEMKGLLWKNEFGYLVAIAAAFFLIGALYGRLHKGLAFLLLGLALFVLANANSASGIVVAAISLTLVVTLWVGKGLRMSALLAVILMIVSPFVIVAVVLNLESATAFVGRDPTLTHRTPIWADALAMIGERPLTGFGLDAVWGDKADTFFPYLPTTSVAAHAHNGYLDLATELGLPAATVAAIYLLILLFRSLNTYIATRSSVALFAFVYLNGFLLYTIVEVGWFQYRRMEWILCVAIIVAMVRRATDEDRSSAPPRPAR